MTHQKGTVLPWLVSLINSHDISIKRLCEIEKNFY